MRKKFLFLIALIMIFSVVLCSFTACFEQTESSDDNSNTDTGDNNDSDTDDDSDDETEPQVPVYGFGERRPAIAPSVQISSDMSAIEMLEAGIANYYSANYVASKSEGAINTKIIGMDFVQFVKSQTVRQGSLSGDYRQFSTNISGSIGPSLIEIMIWEESAIEKKRRLYADQFPQSQP